MVNAGGLWQWQLQNLLEKVTAKKIDFNPIGMS